MYIVYLYSRLLREKVSVEESANERQRESGFDGGRPDVCEHDIDDDDGGDNNDTKVFG